MVSIQTDFPGNQQSEQAERVDLKGKAGAYDTYNRREGKDLLKYIKEKIMVFFEQVRENRR